MNRGLGRLGVYGPILGRLPLRVFSIGKYAFQKKAYEPRRLSEQLFVEPRLVAAAPRSAALLPRAIAEASAGSHAWARRALAPWARRLRFRSSRRISLALMTVTSAIG